MDRLHELGPLQGRAPRQTIMHRSCKHLFESHVKLSAAASAEYNACTLQTISAQTARSEYFQKGDRGNIRMRLAQTWRVAGGRVS